MTQLNILEYYITQRKGLIAWVKTDPRLVTELHWRAAKAMLKDFKTCFYIPKIARERKNCIDKLLLDYKTENKDFRYIVRNGEKDLKVLIKRASEGNILPYRNISLEVLGALTPLKTINKDADESHEEEAVQPGEDFVSPRRTNRRRNYIPKDQIFLNITSILNGFEASHASQRRN